MAIYTKTGDKGTTSLFDGHRIGKNSLRVNTYGTFDELNAQVSVCHKLAVDIDVQKELHYIQQLLFIVCAEVATQDITKLESKSGLIQETQTEYLESIVDTYSAELPSQHSFILSGRYLAAAEIHVARTICRRAERLLISLSEVENVRPELLRFVNRLSDCLYILARKEDFTQFINCVVDKVYDAYLDITHERNEEVFTMGIETIAFTLCNAAKEEAEKMGIPMVISVVDTKGNPILFYRMEGALLVSDEIAPSKAYTAVAFKTPTHTLRDTIQPGNPLFQIESMVNRRIVTFGGGYPIIMNGKMIGGLGISGGTVEQDMSVALAALSVMEDHNGKS